MPKTLTPPDSLVVGSVVDLGQSPKIYGRALVKPAALLSTPPKESQLDRIERKLDALLMALAQDEEQGAGEQTSLDGAYAGRERDAHESLG
jgi:hypothetical protein